MSDLYLSPTDDGGDLVITNGKPEMTGGLDNAVYTSLFTRAWWGNSVSTTSQQYDSDIPRIMDEETLNNTTRNAVIKEAERVLQWMVTDGIAERVEARAEIKDRSTLYLAVTIYEPFHDAGTTFAYQANWENQEVRTV